MSIKMAMKMSIKDINGNVNENVRTHIVKKNNPMEKDEIVNINLNQHWAYRRREAIGLATDIH